MKKRLVCLLLALVLVIGMVPAMAMPAFAASNRATSDKGIEILKQLEGFSATIYDGNLIGYGTQVDPSQYPNAISKEKATELMKEKLKGIDAEINTFAQNNNMTFTQAQHDALASLRYNGIDWKANTKFRDAVLYGKTGTAFIEAIAQWCGGAVNNKFFEGLAKRRFIEANMYLNGQYSMTPPSSYTYTIFDMNGNEEIDAADAVQFYVTSEGAEIQHTVTGVSGSSFRAWTLNGKQIEKLSSTTAKKLLIAEMLGTNQWKTVKYTFNSSEAETLIGYHSPDDAATNQKGEFKDNVTLTAKYECIDANDRLWVYAKGKDIKDKDLEAWIILKPNTPAVKEDAAIAVATINVPSLGAHASATDASGVVFNVTKGTVVNILEFKSLATTSGTQSWGMIKVNGQYGWINLAYADLDEIDSAAGGVTGGKNGTVTGTDMLNVRAKAGVNEALVTTLKRGTQVRVLETVEKYNAVWGRIAWGSGDNEGWVHMKYIDMTGEVEGSANSTTVLFSGTVNADGLNVRKTPDANGEKVDTLPLGTTVDVYQTTTTEGVTWGRIHSGWINLTYITRKAASSTTAKSVMGTVVNCATAVNIRAHAGVDKALVGTAALGSRLAIYEETTYKGVKWGRSDKGWVCMLYINLDEPLSSGGQSDVITTVITTTATITSANLSIFKEADSNSEVLGSLNKGETVTIEEQKTVKTTTGSKIWGKVTDGEVTGWINLAYASLKTTTSSNTTTNNTTSNNDSSASADAVDGVIYDCAAVNVRNAAGARNALVTTLPNGTKVKVLRQVTQDNAPWAEIEWNGGKGWACMYYINTNITQSSTGTGTTTGGTTTGGSSTGSGYSSGIVTGLINLNVRSGPGVNYAKVDSLKPGTRVVITEQQLNGGMIWGKISNGWVSLSYVNLDSVASSGTGAIGQIVRCFSGVNVRSAPGTNNALLGTIQVGSTVEILETKMHGDQEWGRVGQGWISMYYVQMMTSMPPAGTVTPNATEPTQGAQATQPTESTPATEDVPVVTGGVSYAFTATVNAADGLNVRKDASKDADLAGSLNNGTSLSITALKTGDNKTWGYFDQYGTPGWVNLDYVTVTPITGYVSAEKLNIFGTPSTSGSVVGSMDRNASVYATAVALDGSKVMGKVTIDSVTGWIDMSNVSDTQVKVIPTYKSSTDRTGGSQEISATTLAAMSAVDQVNGSEVIFKLDSGVKVYFDYAAIVKAGGNVWAKILANGEYAWIKLDNCSISANGGAKTELNVRASADANAELKGARPLAANESFTIYRFAFASDGKLWAQINSTINPDFNGGYVNLEYVNVF